MSRTEKSAYTDEEGSLAVQIARDAVDSHTADRPGKEFRIPERFNEKRGVFVTLSTWPGMDLRGCIGYPQPLFPLAKALVKAAEGATEDPRFPRLRKEELDKIVVEVSIMTPLELIEVKKPKDYLSVVRIGIDGLVAAQGSFRGLLLPQVPVEWDWDVEEFLSQVCVKAGLLPDAWLDESMRLYRFSSEILSEEEPRGIAKRRLLGGSVARP